MEQRRAVFVAGSIVVLIGAVILGTVLYLNKAFKSSSPKVVTSSPTPSPAALLPSTGSNPASPNTLGVGTKSYYGQGFTVVYPQSWGLLTCSNSQNIELDPNNSADLLSYSCDSALKPITLIVSPETLCSGDRIQLGGTSVIRSKQVLSDGYTKYHWCTLSTPRLDITHRVSQNGERATSKQDYSPQIEQMLSRISFGAGGS